MEDIIINHIPWEKPELFGNEKDLVAQALRSIWISGGPYIEQFENDVANLTNSKCALTDDQIECICKSLLTLKNIQ